MVDIHSARQDAVYIRNAGYGTAASIIEELCDEIKELLEANERLRAQRILDNDDLARAYDMGRDKERHAAVAWLNRQATDDFCALRVREACCWEKAATIIESGEHRREEEP